VAIEAQPSEYRHHGAAIEAPSSRGGKFYFEFIERPGNGIDDG